MSGGIDDTHSQEERQMLRESVRTLLDRAGGVKRAREAREKPEGWSRAVMRQLAEAGALGVAAAEDAGGLGLGLAAAGVIAEEVGRAIAPEPVVATVGLAVGLLERLCSETPLLRQIIAGEISVAVAWQERCATGQSDAIDCRHDGKGLTGAKAWVVGAASADRLLVVASGASGPVLAQVAPDAAGVTLDARRQSDGSALHEIAFAAAAAEVLAEGAAVTAALSDAVSATTALAAAELVGVGSMALELTLEYLKTREQFGQPIGAFQAIQHRAVDLYINQQVAEAGVREALALMDKTTSPQAKARLASRAKARACAAAQKVTRDAIQLHGAVGYTDEFDVGLFLNRALVLSAWLGDASIHRRRWLSATEAREAAQ